MVPDLDRSVEGGRQQHVLGRRVELDQLDLLSVSRNNGLGFVDRYEKATGRNAPAMMAFKGSYPVFQDYYKP